MHESRRDVGMIEGEPWQDNGKVGDNLVGSSLGKRWNSGSLGQVSANRELREETSRYEETSSLSSS